MALKEIQAKVPQSEFLRISQAYLSAAAMDGNRSEPDRAPIFLKIN
jgi:hypothetical protein